MERLYNSQIFVSPATSDEPEAFLRCHGPLWDIDNFTLCFRKDYLQVLLPIIIASISFLILVIGSTHVYYQKWKEYMKSRPLLRRETSYGDDNGSDSSTDTDITDSSADLLGSGSDNEFGNADVEDHLALTRTMSRHSVQDVKLDRPVGEVWWVALEEIAVLAQVVLHVVSFLHPTTSDWRFGKLPALTGAAVWGYTLILTTLRVSLPRTKQYPLPVLWDHTAAIYLSQFLLYTVVLRTVLIYERSGLDRAIVISEFSLVSFLTILVLTTRRGNKAVKQEFIDGLEPSHEPLASLFSLASYSWIDPLIWDGYKTPLEMKRVWNLRKDDFAISVLNSYRQTKKTASLAWRLLKYFKGLLLLQAFWTVFYSLLTFAPTILLRVILEYTENPSKYPRNVAWLYVALLFFTGVVQTTASGAALYIGRRICIRLRAIIIGEIYSKALRRKASAEERTLGQKDDEKKKAEKEKKSKQKKATDEEQATPPAKEEKDESQANVGAIINLMAVDSFKVSEICAYLHFLVAATPVQLTVAIALLYQVLGWSSIAGIGVMIALFPINYTISRQFGRIQNKIMSITDKRIQATNEVLQNVRIIKYFAWEQRYEGVIAEPRSLELKQLRNRYILWGFAASLWYATPIIITFISFWLYTVVEGKELRAPIAFTALSLFAVLRTPLDQFADMITNVLQSKVSIDRVQEFLFEEETEKYKQLKPVEESDDPLTPLIGFKNGHFSWGSKSSINNPDAPSSFQLLNLNVEFAPGQLNIIAGPTGSGKTSLLMALLGEMTHIKGNVYLPGYHPREDLYQDEHGHTESVAYCAQQAWLVNDTIKNNIIFAGKYDEERYKSVLFACSLERDLSILDKGDATEVGEKGISLSGGQKQRISLARALYSNAKHVLLDDCLSAVDSHTAKWIYEYCIMGPLMQYRTCILVTHNVALCVPRAKFVVVMKAGEIAKQGTPEDVVASGALGKDELLKSGVGGSRNQSTVVSRVGSTTNLNKDAEIVGENGTITVDGQVKSLVSTNGTAKADDVKQKKAEEGSKNEESKSEGSVDWKVYQLYLQMMGGWFFWLMVILAIIFQQAGSLGTSIWIREWALQYQDQDATTSTSHHSPGSRLGSFGSSNYCSASGVCAWNFPVMSQSNNFSATGEATSQPHKVNVLYYLTVYALFGLLYSFTSLFREGVVFAGSLKASKRMHDRLLHTVLRAKFRFFDSTPLGRIMNRFSKDLEAVDQEVAPVALGMIHSLASVISIVVLISAITPGFLLAGVVISAIYWMIGLFYLRASRDLKRLESIQRSPLYQHFGETLAGITTIRAYGDERRFVRDNLDKVDTHNRPFFYLWVANRWLSWRVDVAGSLVAFFAGVFVILSVGKIDAGLAGLSLTYAISFNDNVLWVVRLYAMNEQNMNSVERLKEYLELEQEAPEIIAENRPSEDWPAKGEVVFEDYSTRYRDDLDLVLRQVSFGVKPCEKVGIVGRTGAGKSSLALALFRALEASEGKIVIDGIDISKIGLKDLREGITMVPQDPTLFSGTIRSNLDPFGIHTDEEIFTALREVQLIGEDETSSQATLVLSEEPTSASENTDTSPTSATQPVNKNVFLDLSSKITESGNNLSQGQRQLLCLARALLKKPKIILMDEATASIDYATDAKIQETIRGWNSSSVMTIAHRLNTIVDYDRVLVLDHGKVKEYDHPWTLIQQEDGLFRDMCLNSGEMETLEKMAKEAWDRKHPQLVEV